MSPSYRPPADIENLLVSWFRSHLDFGDLVDRRVMTDLDREFVGQKTLQVVLDGGGPVDAPKGHISRPILTLNAYGPKKADAYQVATGALIALDDAIGADHELGVITHVERITGPYPFEEEGETYSRYVTVVAVTVHPRPRVPRVPF